MKAAENETMIKKNKKIKKISFLFLIPLVISTIFFAVYSVLGIVRSMHYQSFGYDLGINDQAVWRYAHFQLPYTTIDPFPDQTKFVEHVELVYALISPLYWIWDSRRMLILAQAAFVCFSGMGVYLFAKKRQLKTSVSLTLVISYLVFYGVQFALWTDVHSAAFGAAFLVWFIYFLDNNNLYGTIIFFILAITAKENIGLLTLLITFVYYIKRRISWYVGLIIASALYILFIFLVFFPHIMHVSYLYATNSSKVDYLNVFNMFNSSSKLFLK